MSVGKLLDAKKNKSDECYTLYDDIEKELSHYKERFKGKVVYCPCDDPSFSNFYKFFVDHFKDYGLKELLCTWYHGTEFCSVRYKDGGLVDEWGFSFNDGDFAENDGFFKKCDIVVTNPPFSLFGDFVETIMRNGKDFLIIGNFLATTLRKVFPYMKNKSVRFGHNEVRRFFNGNKDRENYGKVIEVPHGVWFTTFPVEGKRPIPYNDNGVWQFYDTHNAISCSTCLEIPKGFYGFIGVPCTVFKWDLKDFDIVGLSKSFSQGEASLNGKRLFSRVFLKRKKSLTKGR